MAPDDSRTFGARLRALREAAGLTQEALAERAGLTAKSIAALERGRRTRPYPHTVSAIADSLGLSHQERESLVRSSRPTNQRDSATVKRLPPLPVPLTQLVGRAHEIDEIAELLRTRTSRIVVLTGPGGVGKTRLAIEVTNAVAGTFPDGASVVELAAIRDPALVIPTIVQAVGIDDDECASGEDALAHVLDSREMLLVLDNLEHLLGSVPAIARLLSLAPRLTLLVTSRSPLGIRGERVYPVPSLALPDILHQPSLLDIGESSAVQLLVMAAQSNDPSFNLTAANASTVAAICQRLDGLPLALELVAPHLPILGTADTLNRLERVLSLPANGPRDLPSRHQTLHATIRWSEELLDSHAQQLFTHLSVFVGGFTLSAVEYIAGVASADRDVLDAVRALVHQQLVQLVHQADGTQRFMMLETIRGYALERLSKRGDEHRVRRAHFDYFAQLAAQAEADSSGSDVTARIAMLHVERDNLRAALEWAFNNGEIEIAVRLASALELFWWTSGLVDEGLIWLELGIERREHTSLDVLARALSASGVLHNRRGDIDVALARLQEARHIYRSVGNDAGAAYARYSEGYAQSLHGDVTVAMSAFEDSLREFEELGDHVMATAVLMQQASLWRRLGSIDYPDAIEDELFVRAKATGHEPLIVNIGNRLARLAMEHGDIRRAADYLLDVLDLPWIRQDRLSLSWTMATLGHLFTLWNDPERASQLFGVAEAQLQTGVSGMLRGHVLGHDAAVERVRSSLGNDRFDQLSVEGSQREVEEVIAFAKRHVEVSIDSPL